MYAVGCPIKIHVSAINVPYRGILMSSDMCCDGRVVKALDLKSNGNFPRRFEPCSQRIFVVECVGLARPIGGPRVQ